MGKPAKCVQLHIVGAQVALFDLADFADMNPGAIRELLLCHHRLLRGAKPFEALRQTLKMIASRGRNQPLDLAQSL